MHCVQYTPWRYQRPLEDANEAGGRRGIFFLRRMLECGWCLACWENAKGNCTDRAADENAYECDHRKRTVGIQGISLLCKEILAFSRCKLPLRIGSFRRYNNLLLAFYPFTGLQTSALSLTLSYGLTILHVIARRIGRITKRRSTFGINSWQKRAKASRIARLFLYITRSSFDTLIS